MKSVFLFLLFSGSFSFVLLIRVKYYLIQDGRNWTDAQAFCQAAYIDLAIVKTTEQEVRLLSEAQKENLTSSVWLGLYNDINSWRWSYRNEPLGSMRMWWGTEPNNAGGHQECGAQAVGGWYDRDCRSLNPFVCFDDSKSGADRYINISEVMSWNAAQNYCRENYTDLACTLDPTEYKIVKSFFSLAWIGLFRDRWKWIDNTTFSTLSWMSKKPDNALVHENCGYMNNSQVGDALCSDVMPFFCYTEIRRFKQTVRLRIRSTGDINDPGVKEAIMEQIKQKLTDYGMAENTTATWIGQPDGMVFHKEQSVTPRTCVDSP